MDDEPGTRDAQPRPPGAEGLGERLAAAYDAHAAAMYRYALMLLADAPAAEDAVQQTFVRLAAAAGRSGWPDRPGAYLRTAVRNECYRVLRRRGRNRVVQPASAALLASADGSPADEDRRREIEDALRVLPPEQREVVHMKVYERMTFRQIAVAAGISPNTAASRYRYAVEKLRRLLAPLETDEDR